MPLRGGLGGEDTLPAELIGYVPELGKQPEINAGDLQAVFFDFVRADSDVTLYARCIGGEVEGLRAFPALLPVYAVADVVTALPASWDHVIGVNGDIHDSVLSVEGGFFTR